MSRKFERPDFWFAIVKKIDSLESFKCVASEMFTDLKNVNDRLYILELFAKDVIQEYPKIRKDVWKHYCDVSDRLLCEHKNWLKMCWLFGKYEKIDLATTVAEILLSIIVDADF